MSVSKGYRFFIGQGPNGTFTAFSTTEPCFCFVRDTEEEAYAVAQQTYESFHQYFRMAEKGRLVTTEVSLPIQKIRPKRAFAAALQVA